MEQETFHECLSRIVPKIAALEHLGFDEINTVALSLLKSSVAMERISSVKNAIAKIEENFKRDNLKIHRDIKSIMNELKSCVDSQRRGGKRKQTQRRRKQSKSKSKSILVS